jgi:pilus assembly protein CpaC
MTSRYRSSSNNPENEPSFSTCQRAGILVLALWFGGFVAVRADDGSSVEESQLPVSRPFELKATAQRNLPGRFGRRLPAGAQVYQYQTTTPRITVEALNRFPIQLPVQLEPPASAVLQQPQLRHKNQPVLDHAVLTGESPQGTAGSKAPEPATGSDVSDSDRLTIGSEIENAGEKSLPAIPAPEKENRVEYQDRLDFKSPRLTQLYSEKDELVADKADVFEGVDSETQDEFKTLPLSDTTDAVLIKVVDPDVQAGNAQGLQGAEFDAMHVGPFEVIEPLSIPIRVKVRRGLLMRTDFDIYRSAVVDPAICDLVQLKPVANKLIVRGQAKDSQAAAQIMQIVRREMMSGLNTSGGNFGTAVGPDMFDATAASVLYPYELGGKARVRNEFRVVNMLQVPGPQQVALRVKIAELNRSATRGFGVNVDTDINISETAGLFVESMLNAVGGNAPSVLAQFDGDDIGVGIRWLEQEGVIRMLSEPTLVTMSGRPATFVAGGEFAVPTVVGVGGVGAVTTDFRTFGAIISFLPVVIDKDRIRLQVSPEFSQINSALTNNDAFGLDVRAVTTTVEMREGQTLAIAGLLDESMKGTKIGDLPILSHIFGRRDMSRTETELIILVTPELVHPMEPEEVPPLPGFDVTEPDNRQFFLHGELEGLPTQNYRSTIWPRLRHRYQGNGPAMISGPFGHGE